MRASTQNSYFFYLSHKLPVSVRAVSRTDTKIPSHAGNHWRRLDCNHKITTVYLCSGHELNE